MTSRSPIPSQRRVVYLNVETPNKDPSTIFHSPYTNGKRSKDYANPTLISSSVFYDYKTNNVEFKSGQLDHFGRPKSPYHNQPEAFIVNEDKSPGRSATPDRSKTPRRKKQFDQNKEYIKDHFSQGLVVSAETKRPQKKYINLNNNQEYIQQNCSQAETIKFYLGQVQDRSMKKSTSQINLDQLSTTTGAHSNNISALGQNDQSSTPLKRNNSFILSRKKGEDDYYSTNKTQSIRKENIEYQQQQQLPQTPVRNRDQMKSTGGYERSMTPNTLQRYLNDQFQYQQSTPQRKADNNLMNSNGGNSDIRSLTPSQMQKYKQTFTPLKECCDRCINQKIVSEKHQKEKGQREIEQQEQTLIIQRYKDEQTRQKQLSKEKKDYTRKQYGQYVKQKTEEDKKQKMEQIQENILYNEKMNKLIEQEKQIELERMKQQKIQKIKMYSQKLKEQIEQKELLRKNQMQREREDNERNNQIQMRAQQERSFIQQKITPNMVEYREQLLNQQIQHDIAKNKEKNEDQQMYKKIQEQVSKYSEQEKELLRSIKQKKKQEFETYVKQRDQIIKQRQEEKKKIDQEALQKFKDIENEDHLKRLNSKRVEKIQKQNFCNVLKEQIQEKEVIQQIRKQEDLKKSISTTLLLNPSYQEIQKSSLSPCYTCNKKVPKYQLALFN